MIYKQHLARYKGMHFLRHPRTLNEMKQSFVDDEELTPHQANHIIRAKRRPNNLPTNWDDKVPSVWTTAFCKLWHKYRRQYRRRHND